MQQLNVLGHHALYPSLSEAKKLAEEQYKKFDEYDVRTNAENMEKLHNSLDEKLLKMLKNLTPNQEKDRLFAIHWLQLVEIVQKHMLTYLQGIQDQVKKLKPQSKAREHIREYCTDVLELAKPLVHAGQYPQELTLAVIEWLLTAGGDAGHAGRTIFQSEILEFRRMFLSKLELMGLKTPAEKAQEMELAGLSLQDLCTKATQVHSSLLQENSWQPARQTPDSSVAP
jgi:hypothetical protein